MNNRYTVTLTLSIAPIAGNPGMWDWASLIDIGPEEEIINVVATECEDNA